MTMHAIVGELGSGKTLFMTLMLGKFASDGKKIYSTYATVFTDEIVKDIDALVRMRRGVFAMDDAYMLANSRDKRNKTNIILSKSRKRGIDIVWSATRTNQVDLNIRFNTQFIWFPRIVNNWICGVDGYKYDTDAGDTDIERAVRICRRYAFKPFPLYNLYDTEEEVTFDE